MINGLRLLLLFCPAFAMAATWDSVMVIIRPEKVLVQINERGSIHSGSRLQGLFETLKADGEFLLLSADNSIKLNCGRSDRAASCVIRLTPSETVNIASKRIQARMDLGIKTRDFNADFVNSNGDHLRIWIRGSRLYLQGGKR